ncbi:hypothetical protein [Pendulispora albinea]|uniref:Uncharacterized protein n=1 Tax=Pendulispora albinea TaxID=2741071 RepID=A0ABZ2LUH8_9BACT
MIALPPALRPWEKQLAIFPPEVALALGALAARLAGLVGGAGPVRSHSGVFDGFSGLTRRGAYERLLTSEWLLQEELPDEFLRRAVSGEHAFLERAYRHESKHGHTRVLFDAGPEQLGAPRIVHLAALIVLAQRAESRQTALSWGILQDRTRTMHAQVTPESVRALLRGRSLRRASVADFERWCEAGDAPAARSPQAAMAAGGGLPAGAVTAVTEMWWVGPAHLAEEAPRRGAYLLGIEESMDPAHPSRLAVSVCAPGTERSGVSARLSAAPAAGRPREVTLELPAPILCVRMLRDPFAVAVAPCRAGKTPLDPRTSILFSPEGRALHVRTAGGALLTFPIPNSPRTEAEPTRMYVPPEGHAVLAVGRSGRRGRTVVLTRRGSVFALHTVAKRGWRVIRTEEHTADEDYEPWPVDSMRPLALLGILDEHAACFIDDAKRLVTLVRGRVEIVDDMRCVAPKVHAKGFGFLRADAPAPVGPAQDFAFLVQPDDKEGVVVVPSGPGVPCRGEDPRVFVGAAEDLVAVAVEGSRWEIHRGSRTTSIAVPEGQTVIGVLQRGHARENAFLVVLNGSRTKVGLLREPPSETLFTTTTPITCAAVSTSAPHIAYFTAAGELGIYSCGYGAMLLRIDTPRDAPARPRDETPHTARHP